MFRQALGHQCARRHPTVYPKKYAHGFVVLCFVVVMQSFIMNSHEVFIHIHQGCIAGTGAIVRLPQRQWSKPDGYGKISQCITTTKHSKANTVWIFLGIYCSTPLWKSNPNLFSTWIIYHLFFKFVLVSTHDIHEVVNINHTNFHWIFVIACISVSFEKANWSRPNVALVWLMQCAWMTHGGNDHNWYAVSV